MSESNGATQHGACSSAASPSVLVIDDDEGIRGVVSRFLTERGYRVEPVADGNEGLAALRQRPLDVVLLDLEMPKVSGLDVLRAIRAEGIETVVIAISGHPAAEDRLAEDSRRLGAIDFLVKPFDLEQLLASIVAVLGDPGDEAAETTAAG